jgi:predicted ATPase
MFLEDLHWADEESLAFIDELVDHSSAPHLLVVGVSRPTLLEGSGAASILERSSLALVLEPLGTDATHALVNEILQQADRVRRSWRNSSSSAPRGTRSTSRSS